MYQYANKPVFDRERSIGSVHELHDGQSDIIEKKIGFNISIQPTIKQAKLIQNSLIIIDNSGVTTDRVF